MKAKVLFASLFVLLASAAFASSQPVVAFTFVCNGHTTGPCPDGNGPNSLIQGSDGNFYGTTEFSAVGETPSRAGTVFSLTPAGKFALLHTFAAGTNGVFANGANPASLTEGPDGKLYGLTSGGSGAVFRIGKTGSGFKVIHRFCSAAQCSDGSGLAGVLVVATDGNICGATTYGGTGCSGVGCGTIFRVTPSSGAYKVVATFSSDVVGFPYGLTLAPDGTFFGLTANGATLFHFVPATGELQSMTLSFPFPSGCGTFACFTIGPLAFGPNGNLYGLYTEYDLGGSGLFELETDGSHVQLFPLYNTMLAGDGPMGLMLASDDNFWIPGSTGGNGNGDVVTLSPSDGSVLQSFAPFSTSAAVGASPSSLLQGKDGTLWGTTMAFGAASKNHFGGGTVFNLNAGLPPR